MIPQTTQTDTFTAAGGGGATSKEFSVEHIYTSCIEFLSTGGTGTVSILGSVSGDNYVEISGTSQAYSNATPLLINLDAIGYCFLKVKAVGSGSISVSVSLKG